MPRDESMTSVRVCNLTQTPYRLPYHQRDTCWQRSVNQTRMKVGVTMGSPETTVGGQALKFCCSDFLGRSEILRTGTSPA
ncbi:MAG: hypothetical protein FJ100_11150 [Deltaproteobacteria bacterium]|nr:hypothetical protein [Deltaproteobacteria bacterium]